MTDATTMEPIPKADAGSRKPFDLVLMILALATGWQLASFLAGSVVLPGPVDTARALWTLLGEEECVANAWETARAFGLGLVIAIVAGLFVGIALGANRLAGDVAEPILVALYSIPKITLYPVILLLFGLGLQARVAFGAIHGFFPIAIFTMAAVRSIPPVHFRTARSLRLGPVGTALHVVLPGALPEIVSGLRVGFSLTLLGTLIGEMFASQRGLGHMLVRAMETANVRPLMALALLLIAFATTISAVLLWLDRGLHARASR
jgi:NitT/TauT family transport system permease protein